MAIARNNYLLSSVTMSLQCLLEKLSVVPKMLFADSEVMWSDLQVKNFNEKVPTEIIDISQHI